MSRASVLPLGDRLCLFAAITAIHLQAQGRTEVAETARGGGSVRLAFHRGRLWRARQNASVVRNMECCRRVVVLTRAHS